MNILQEILKSQGGEVVGQLAKQFGVSPEDAQKALSNLVPAVAGGIKKTASSQTGLEALLGKVNNNRDLRRSVEQPSVLEQSSAAQTGNEILADIFGSKDVSRQVAGQTATSTGLDSGMLKKMLPLVAGLVLSSLNKRGQSSGGGLGDLLGALVGTSTPEPKTSGGLGGLLGTLFGSARQNRTQQSGNSEEHGLESLLDFDGDGDISDDVLNLAKKLF